MKLLTKVMTGVSVAALSVLAVGAVNSQAATIEKNKTISGIAAGDMVSFDAIKIKQSAPTYNANAKWDLYEKGSSADLSILKTTKDSYITVKSAATTTIYKVNKDTQKKFKATCDGSTIAIKVDDKDVAAADMVNYEWRTENSSAWTKFTATALDLTPYTMQGATFYIRYTSPASKTITPGKEKVTVAGTELTVQDIPADYFLAKEIKVKVPKKANAPAIKVDYANGVIKKNAGAVTKTGAGVSAILSSPFSTDKMLEDFRIDNSQAGAFMMQIPADTAKNKPASKTAVFEWALTSAPTVAYTKPAVSGTTITNKTGDLINGKLSYKAVDNADANKATFEITNKDADNTYEIFKGKTENGKIVPDGKAVAVLKKGVTKPVVLNAKKAAADTNLYVRIAGDKASAKLPSPLSASAFQPVYLATPSAS